MRLSLTFELGARAGAVDKDERLTNTLVAVEGKERVAELRPGLDTAATSTGTAGGLVCFDGVLISVFGTTLGFGIAESAGSTGTDSWGFVGNSYIEYLAGVWYIPQIDMFQRAITYVTYTPSSGVLTTEAVVTASTLASVQSLAVGAGKVVVACRVDTAVKLYDITGTPSLLVTVAGFKYCSIRFLNGLFIAVSASDGETSGGTYIHTSPDGVTWTQYFYADADLLDIAWTGSKYVLIGYGYPLDTYGTCTAHTTDFTSFTLHQIASATVPEQIFSQICFIDGTYYATDYNNIGTVTRGESSSSDGIVWTDTGSPAHRYKYDTQLAKWVRSTDLGYSLYATSWSSLVSLDPMHSIAFATLTEWVATAGLGVWYAIPPEATIPALATIAQGHYDFCQSPI